MWLLYLLLLYCPDLPVCEVRGCCCIEHLAHSASPLVDGCQIMHGHMVSEEAVMAIAQVVEEEER
jgi:hypothetical protein